MMFPNESVSVSPSSIVALVVAVFAPGISISPAAKAAAVAASFLS